MRPGNKSKANNRELVAAPYRYETGKGGEWEGIFCQNRVPHTSVNIIYVGGNICSY